MRVRWAEGRRLARPGTIFFDPQDGEQIIVLGRPPLLSAPSYSIGYVHWPWRSGGEAIHPLSTERSGWVWEP